MSKRLVLAVWERNLPPPLKNVLAAIAWNADNSGNRAWPSISTVADRSGYKARQVHNIIAKLKARGILKAERRLGQAHGFVTEYSIDLSGVPLLSGARSVRTLQASKRTTAQTLQSLSVQSDEGSVQFDAGSVQSATPKCATAIAEEQYEQEKPNSKTELDTAPDLDGQQATTRVCLELSLAGSENRMVICDSVRSCMHTLSLSPREAAEMLVKRWEDYERLDITYKRGKVKFFKEGVWRNPESWTKTNGATREKSKHEQRVERSLAAIENA